MTLPFTNNVASTLGLGGKDDYGLGRLLRTSDQFLMDAYTGKGGFVNGFYLIRHSREADDKFYRRRLLATYPNFCRKIVNVYSGFLWKSAPQRTNVTDNYVAFMANANGAGQSIDNLLASYQRLAMIMGTVYVIVDKPNQAASNRAEDNLPYLALRFPSQLVDEKKNAVGEWDSVTFSETDAQETYYRTFTRTGWILSEDNEGKQIIARGDYDLGVVPVVKLHNSEPLEPSLSKADSFFYDLAALNWELYNLGSELREILREQTFSVLAIPYNTKEEFERLMDMTIGVNNGLAYPSAGSARPEFISPSADSANVYEQRIAKVIDLMYRVANLEFVGGVQQSGVALNFHFQEANSSLGMIASSCERAELAIADLVARWQKETFAGSIRYNTEFNLTDIQQALQTTMDAVTLNLGSAFDAALKKTIAKQLLGHETSPDVLAEIDAEIDAQGDVYGNRMQQQAVNNG